MRFLSRSSVSFLLTFAAVAGCARSDPPPARDAAPPPVAVKPPPPDPAAEEAAHHRALVEAAHTLFDGGSIAAWDGARLGATNFVTSVLSAPLWPEDADGGQESIRLGYLRHGARVPVIPDPIMNESCPDGWFELVQGGFVCGKNGTLDPKNPRVRLAPHGPDLAKSLPYEYGVNIANGTPLYRRVLSLEDRKKYEPWLAPKPPPAAPAASEDDEEPTDAGAPSPAPAPSAIAAPANSDRPAHVDAPTRRPPGTSATAGAKRSPSRSSTATGSSSGG